LGCGRLAPSRSQVDIRRAKCVCEDRSPALRTFGASHGRSDAGIPDEAFTPIEGDDREICSKFKKVNKNEKKGQARLFDTTTDLWEQLSNLAASMVHLDDASDDSIEAVRNKERMYEAMVRSGNYLDGQFWADAWCAAFVWKKTEEFNYPITEEVFRRIADVRAPTPTG